MNTRLYSNRTYGFLFSLLGVVYLTGLIVPLMDNDSAHHANIALHMYLHHDYVNLVSSGKDYLDKPHLLFWLAALCYKIFGVTTFAYKFPSFCISILGVWSTYKLGKALYDTGVGKLAALIIASAFAFMLSNNDVRMDAILTAFVAFATWQGVAFVQQQNIINAIGLAFGLALGFSTKGQIAVMITGIGLFFYILYRRDYLLFRSPKWVLVFFSFALFIFPVVYCYYVQFNLHPEKTISGKSNINGVAFILFGQGIERFLGQRLGGHMRRDYFFFLHSFIWAFAPWSLLAYIAVADHVKSFFNRNHEWLTPLTFILIALLLTLSNYKLPHYINIIFPATAVMTASLILSNSLQPKYIYYLQVAVCICILIAVITINVWAFPINNLLVAGCACLLLIPAIYFFINQRFSYLQKSIGISVPVIVFCFFLLNTNFYPQLLKYQGGNELAKKIKGKLNPGDVYFWQDNHSSSFSFYSASERQQFTDSVFEKTKKPVWLLFAERNLGEINRAGYSISTIYESPDYEITMFKFRFINPATRGRSVSRLIIGKLARRESR